MEVIFQNVSKKDGKKLTDWWNANTPHLHFLVKQDNSKFYKVVRQS